MNDRLFAKRSLIINTPTLVICIDAPPLDSILKEQWCSIIDKVRARDLSYEAANLANYADTSFPRY